MCRSGRYAPDVLTLACTAHLCTPASASGIARSTYGRARGMAAREADPVPQRVRSGARTTQNAPARLLTPSEADSVGRKHDSVRRQFMWKNFYGKRQFRLLRSRWVQDFPRVAPCPSPPGARPCPALTRTSPSCTCLQKEHYGLWRVGRRASIPRKSRGSGRISRAAFRNWGNTCETARQGAGGDLIVLFLYWFW